MTNDKSNHGDRDERLLLELQHRVRNALATTRLIARRSAETSESLEDYVAHLDGRLAALARVQNAVIRDPLSGIDLGLLVSDEFAAAGPEASRHARADGPMLLLHPRAAEPFALALHELMTNAIKFGALSAPTGRLSVSWRVDVGATGSKRLVFDWDESGMNLGEPAERREGFGTIVLNEMLRHTLSAETDIVLRSTGLACRIIVPLTERVLSQI